MRKSSLGLVAVVCAVVLAGASCQTQPPTVPPPGPETPVWVSGDSIAHGTGSSMYPHPYRTAQGGTGFTTARLEVVSDQISSEIAEHGAPETIVIMAGVIDVSKGATTAAIIAEMASVEADLVSQDINVVWLAEPGWTYAAQLAPIVDWVKTRPNWIDCRASAGASQDGIHPNSYTAMAACVNVELAGLGFGL